MSNRDWRELIESLADGRMQAAAFERAFLDLHRAAVAAGERVPYAVDLMFYEVDAYCADPALRSPGDNDDDMLRAHAQRLLARMDEPWPRLPGSPTDAQIMKNFRAAAARLMGKKT